MWWRRTVTKAVAIVSMAAVIGACILARWSQWPIIAPLIIAMAWGAAPQAIDAFIGRDRSPDDRPVVTGSFTVVVHVGRQSLDISRVGVTAAVAAAPAVVVTTDPTMVDRLGPLPCPMFVGTTIEDALDAAAATIETDGMLVISASSFVDVAGAARAAGCIVDGAAWVTGDSQAFNADGFSPLVRARLGNRLRRRARAGGLPLWEPNATMVSTRSVREAGFSTGRPWAAMLRSWQARGAYGVEQAVTMSMSAEPVDARSYWPASVLRRRRAVADLADAASSCRGRRRLLAVGLLLRELDGCVLAIWLISPWLITRSDIGVVRGSMWLLVALTVVPAVMRWAAARVAHHVSLHPLEDMLALAYDAPSSVLAVPTAFSRHLTRTRLGLPGQPFVVAGLLFTAITAVPLFTVGTTARRSEAVGLALTELALLWLLAMRVVFQRNWARATYRIRAPLAAWIDGREVTTLDVSPTGLSLIDDRPPPGSDVSIDVALDDGSMLAMRGVVVDCRLRGASTVLGVALHIAPIDESRWIEQLSRAASNASSHAVHSRTDASLAAPPAKRTVTTWLGHGIDVIIIVVSVLAVAALCLSAIGYRPLIVRSGSMEPALGVGDVVLVEDIEARQLNVGDVATLGDAVEVSDSLTHRVEAIQSEGSSLVVTTRGDANVDSETFTLQPRATVGRVVTRLAGVGALVAWAGSPRIRLLAAGLGGAALLVVVVRGRRRRNQSRSARATRQSGSAGAAATVAATPASMSTPAAASSAS